MDSAGGAEAPKAPPLNPPLITISNGNLKAIKHILALSCEYFLSISLNICCEYPIRQFFLVPTTYVLVEK